jgi:hypothetical protein
VIRNVLVEQTEDQYPTASATTGTGEAGGHGNKSTAKRKKKNEGRGQLTHDNPERRVRRREK